MRIALGIIIVLHGFIHLFGFLKAFNYVEFQAISQAISKTTGVFWLIAFLLFGAASVMLIFSKSYWWGLAWIAVGLSQVLIFKYWSDAKFGTIVNIIILFAGIIAFSKFSFQNLIDYEKELMFKSTVVNNAGIISKDETKDLPPVVRKWLENSGALDHSNVHNVYLKQNLSLKLKPEQKDWYPGKAEQYFSIEPMAFHWNIKTSINGILSIRGRDKLENGKGEMLIKLLSLIPVVDVKGNEKIDEATLQRYLAEIVWFPSAALHKHIDWEPVDDVSARAILTYKNVKVLGTFHFDENGLFKSFSTLRYKDINDNEPSEWIVKAKKTEKRNGVYIPVSCEASWKLDSKLWTWLKLDITSIDYNVKTPEQYAD